MKPYPEYKDSGVEWIGEIPVEWEVLKIKRLCMVKRGASPRPIDDPKYFDEDGDYAWVRISDVSASEKYLYKTTQKLSSEGVKESRTLEPDEIFLSIAGSVGKAIITKIKCCIHDGFVYFDGLRQNREFLFFIFSCPTIFIGLGKHGTQLNLNTDTIGDIYIPLPSVEEQKLVVSFINTKTQQIDQLIQNKQQKIKLLQEKRTAVINQAVTKGLNPEVEMKDSGVEWIGEIPKGWDVLKFKMITSIMTCGYAATPEYFDDGMMFLSAQNIKRGELDLFKYNYISNELHLSLTKNKKVEKGDLLQVRVGGAATIGETCVVDIDDEFSIYVSLSHIRLNEKAYSHFIKFLCNSSRFKENCGIEMKKGAGVANLNIADLEKYKVPLPPLPEQQQIVSYLDTKTKQIDQLVSKEQRKIELLQEYRQSLISDAVTGKIDVREAG